MTGALLSVSHLTVRFGGLAAIDDASFDIERNGITALIGPNGAGKTTMLQTISGFQQPTSGTVRFGDHDITGLAPDIIAGLGITRSFQHVEIIPELTAIENVIISVPRRGRWNRPRRSTLDAARAALGEYGLESSAHIPAADLSYGEQKLVALARSMVAAPEVVMLDEPGAGLPPDMLATIGRTLRRVVDETDRTILLVDHNVDLIFGYSDRVIVMHHGAVVATGSPDDIRNDRNVVDIYLGTSDAPAD